MSQKERPPLSEVTSKQVYSKAREILDLHGHPGTRPTLLLTPRPSRHPRIIRGTDIPITECPIVPIQIAGNDYRLWLRSEDDSQPDNRNGTIELNIHFQQLPDGLDRIEYDNEGNVTGYWYKPADQPELTHLRVYIKDFLPKELQLGWYLARSYSLRPNASSKTSDLPFPSEITAGLGDSNEFLLTILENMQTELENKSA